MVTPEMIDRARKAAIDCAYSNAWAQMGLNGDHALLSVDAISLDQFQEKAAEAFGRVAEVWIEVNAALSGELLRWIEEANATRDNLRGVAVDGRRFATWHEAALHIPPRVLLIPVQAAIHAGEYEEFSPILNSENSTGWKHLREILLDYSADDREEYWNRVAAEVEAVEPIECENMAAEIRREAANAKTACSRVSDDEWPRQSEVAKRMERRRDEITRLVKTGDLTTNGKAGHECRINPSSILAYCKREGIAYNES